MKIQLKNNGSNRIQSDAIKPSEVRGISVLCPKFNIQTAKIKVRGISPLICHAWSQKAIDMMLAKHMGTALPVREKKNPLTDFKNSLYYLPDKKGLGIPAPAFKNCMVSSANDVEMKMTEIKRSIHVSFYLIPIIAPTLPKEHWSEWDFKHEKELKWYHERGCGMRQDLVRLQTGVADIRFRGWFPVWECELLVEFSKVLTLEQVANLLRSGGFGTGVGEWRPGAPECRSGEYGRFEVC